MSTGIFRPSCLALLVAAALPVWPQTATELFVAPGGNDTNPGTVAKPFATLTRARDEVRKRRRQTPSAPVTVYLRGGLYPMREPIVFTPEDSGSASAPVTYAAYRNERPVVSGGVPVKGWTKGANGVWTTTIDDVKAGKWYFNQLFVDGKFRHRARTPNQGFLRVKGMPEGTPKTANYHKACQTFEFAPGDIHAGWHNLEDVEVIVYHFWTDSHLPVASVDSAKNLVTFRNKASKVFTDDFTENGARYVVENVLEALDEPGEWYLDRKSGVLSYIPVAGEDMTRAQVIAPAAPALMRFSGAPEERRFVSYLNFRGLTFEHTDFHLPPGNSNGAQGSASVTGAIEATGLRNATFEQCAFRNLGTWAIDLKDGSRNNRIVHNEFANLAAGGVRINGGTEGRHPLRSSGGNTVADNLIHHWGEIYPSAVGVLLMHSDSNTVEHNEIHHGWYTGISIGWRWGYARSTSRDNRIEYNHIHDIGQGLLSDMGGIYTLGVSPGTAIRYNHIHDVDANQCGGWGIYHDEGSTHILTEKNLVYNTKYCPFNIHYSKEVTVRNNIFAFGRIDQVTLGRVEPHVSVYFENNIVYWTDGVLMKTEKADEPYKFWVGANKKFVDSKDTVDSDWNIFFNPNQTAAQASIGKSSFAEWQKRGKDQHSRYADPLFVDAAKRDFRLRPESPALALGFEEFDVKTAGVRGVAGPK